MSIIPRARRGRRGKTMAGNAPANCVAERSPGDEELAIRGWELLNRASIEALRGRESLCRGAAAQAGILGESIGLAIFDVAAEHVLGLLELSIGNLPVAAWHLSRCERIARALQLGDPHLVRFEPDLVEVLVATGRRGKAHSVAAALDARARSYRCTWALVAAARCRGLLADDSTFRIAFTIALELAETEGNPFERARTELCFGERLRRARRRAEARDHLSRALDTFRAIGATRWAERAVRELEASSPVARRRGDPSNIDDLTPQEQQTARILAQGATIREAATSLFLSPKTVEAHLGRAYRKLGVHNRAQLVAALARDASIERNERGNF
jgi:DNA-binding CsgD family transcriptional regulator